MKVLFLVPYPLEGASYRYRVHQFLPYLEKEGIQYKISSFMSKKFYKIVYKKRYLLKKILYTLEGIGRRFINALVLFKYNIIFIHLESSPFPLLMIEYLAKLLHKPLIYDLDDALFMETTNGSKVRKILKSHKKISRIISMSSHIIVCNNFLKNFAAQYINEKQITIIPTPIDTKKFFYKNKNTSTLCIGWIGSHSTFQYLKTILDIFPLIAQKYSFILKIVGAPVKVSLPGVTIVQKGWSLNSEIDDFQSLDIGLYPLINDAWVKGKTGFKPIQYMAAGVPCIASDIEHNREIIKNGLNGFLVNTKDEWINTISTLLSEHSLRKKITQEGRKTVEEHFSLKVHAPLFVKTIKKFDLNENHAIA